MVASTHWVASSIGMSTLERGGNAADAAVAAGFALQVVEPHLNGPGGEVPILILDASADDVRVIDGQGVAPAAATIERVRGLGHELIPGTGTIAACVPGAFGAWMLLLAEFGTMSLRDVLQPAIEVAGSGYPVVARIATTVASMAETFRTEWPSSAEVYLARGAPRAGELFTNTALAATYARIVNEAEASGGDRDAQIDAARRAFYEGFVADAIDDFCRADEGSLIRGSDLAAWRAAVEEPVQRGYRDYTVYKCGPWTQGPVFLQQLALLEATDLRATAHCSADHIHSVVEAAKLAFADRECFYGDPRFVDVPLDVLLTDEYAAERRRLIGEAASLELRPGSPGGRAPVMPPVQAIGEVKPRHLAGSGEPTRGDTCQVDVVDRWGNMVAATPSGGWLQSSPVIPGLGFPLGTRMQMFWLEQSHPNALQPGKRPRTTLTPTIARSDDETIAFGTPGGDTQDQWSLNFFLAHADFGMNLQAAIDAPMFHTNHFPSSFYPRASAPGQIEVEGRVPADVLGDLRERGHDIVAVDDWSLGRLSAVSKRGRLLRAAANPRGMQGYAVGR